MNDSIVAWQDSFKRTQDRLPGAATPWLLRMRSKAMESFQQQGLPDTRMEDWKYTSLRRLLRSQFVPADDLPVHTDLSPWLFGDEPMHRLVFVDGYYRPDLQPFRTLLTGATLCSLATALEECPDVVEPVLGHTLDINTPGFNALNTAFLQDGAWIRLEQDAELELPVHLLYISTGQPDAMTTHRNLIVAGAGSSATIIESWISLNDATGLTNTVTEIMLEDNATLSYYKLEQEDETTTHVGGTHVRQAAGSRFASYSVTLGGRLVRNDLQVALHGPGAECTLNGLTLTHGHQHVDNHTRIDHHSPQATSNELYKGILDDRSRTVFSGRIVVHPDAQKSRAQQSCHSLLLSADAEVDARPQFEIHADDVQCSHGCTAGQLDEDAYFYLRSRALDASNARALLVYAFAADILERIPLEYMRNWLDRQLSGRLDTEVRQ